MNGPRTSALRAAVGFAVALPAVVIKRLSMAQPTSRLLVRLGLAAMAIVVVATLFSRPSSSASTYLVVDLATLKQEPGAIVRGPNAAGDAVGGGRVAGAGAHRGLLFTQGGVQGLVA